MSKKTAKSKEHAKTTSTTTKAAGNKKNTSAPQEYEEQRSNSIRMKPQPLKK